MHTQPNTHMPIGPRVKTYTAKLTQTGTNPPAATVIVNSLGTTLDWTHDSAGYYLATLNNPSGIFGDGSNVTCIISGFLGATVQAGWNDANSIFVATWEITSGTWADNQLIDVTLQINVYN